jgi:NifU-like protein involved in Fe-S cluster formation
MELSDLYSSKIIEIAARLPIIEPLAEPDAKLRKISRVCGSTMIIAINIQDGVVSDYSHDVSACALGQTAASIMAEHIIGSKPDDLRQLRNIMFSMLKENGESPNGKWSNLEYLQSVRDFPARHTSTMLVFDAVVECLDMIEKGA